MTPNEIFEIVLRIFPIERSLQLDQVVEDAIILARGPIPRSKLCELADEKKSQVKRLMDSYISECNSRHVPPKFLWSDSYPGRLVGRCFVKPEADTEEKLRKSRLRLIEELATRLPLISPTDFEELSSRIVGWLGARSVTVTGRRGDEGIDFDGEYVYREGILEGEARPILGQSKRWSNPVDTEDMSRFGEAYLRAVVNRPGTIGIFLTTSVFRSGAADYARKHGIIARDGEWVATKLLEHGIGYSAGEPPTVDMESLTGWLADSGPTCT